ncbi:MAG TPA: hypothetical protein VF930_13285 [Stellaceae bacterium]
MGRGRQRRLCFLKAQPWDDDELVYVGATRTLRSELVGRLLDHASDATHFSWEITYDPEPRQRELIAEFEAAHHRPPRLN